MIDAIRSEAIKLRTARSNLVLLILAVAVPIALTILLTSVVGADDVTTNDLFDLIVAGVGIGQILTGVLGVLVIGQEYRHNTIRVTLTAEPSRLKVMVAKAITVAGTALLVGAVATLFSYVLGNAILTSRGLDLVLDGTTQARALIGAAVLFALYGLCGLGLGTIIRATAGAITLLVVWPVIVEPIVNGLLPKLGKWLPFTAASQLVSTGPRDPDTLSPLSGGVLFAVFALILVVIGTFLVARRDA